MRRGAEQAVALIHTRFDVPCFGLGDKPKQPEHRQDVGSPHPMEVRVRHSFTEVKVRVRVRVRHSKLMAKHS